MSADPSAFPEGDALEIPCSFRDPDGRVFRIGHKLYRAIHERGLEHIAWLHNSGLYEELTSRSLLIPHTEAPAKMARLSGARRVIEPQLIPFISQPYEWCFSQLRDAAKCTLQVQNLALEKSMILADASAFNIQFHRGSPLLMDTLSLKSWNKHRPWDGYRQFCEPFLGPLALSSYRGVDACGLLQVWMEGIPLRIATNRLYDRAKKLLDALTPRGWPMHPLCLACFCVLLWYRDTLEINRPSVLAECIAIVTGLVLLLQGALGFVWRERFKGAILLSAFLFLFLRFTPIALALQDLVFVPLGIAGWIRARQVLATLLVLIALWAVRSKSQHRSTTRYLNVVSLMLVAATGIEIATSKAHNPIPRIPIASKSLQGTPPQPGEKPPDIYLMIFDSFTSFEQLKLHWGYESAEMKGFLILQGDHGSRALLDFEGEKESFHCLNAMLLPHGGGKLVRPGLSPVNTFRLILRHYFGVPLDLIEDKQFNVVGNTLRELHLEDSPRLD